MNDMEKITHLADRKEWKTLCGHEINCGTINTFNVDSKVHHCATTSIDQVSCADCVDTYAHQNKTTEQMNLDTAFKIIAAKDKEIEQLENDIEHLKFETITLRHAFRSAINEPTAFKIIKL